MTNAPCAAVSRTGCRNRQRVRRAAQGSCNNRSATIGMLFGCSIQTSISGTPMRRHVLMPDGSMKLGGEAVAKVLLDLPNTKWFAGVFTVRTFGFRPFQAILNVIYAILAAVRPLFGCESCGGPGVLLRSLAWIKWTKAIFGGHHGSSRTLHFTSLSASGSRPLRATEELHGQTRHL